MDGENKEDALDENSEENEEELDNDITEIFSELEVRLTNLEKRIEQLASEIASSRELVSEHANRYEHREKRVEDTGPGERHFYFRRLGN